MCPVKRGLQGLRSEIPLHEMESGRGVMKVWGAGGAGVKKVVEMEVPKRRFVRRSEVRGPHVVRT